MMAFRGEAQAARARVVALERERARLEAALATRDEENRREAAMWARSAREGTPAATHSQSWHVLRRGVYGQLVLLAIAFVGGGLAFPTYGLIAGEPLVLGGGIAMLVASYLLVKSLPSYGDE